MIKRPGKKARRLLICLLALLVPLTTTACAADETERLVSETQILPEFTGLAIDGFGQVTVTQGEENTLAIIADPSLLNHITYAVANGILSLKVSEEMSVTSFNPQTDTRFVITARNLDSIQNSGSAQVVVSGFSGKNLQVIHAATGTLSLNDVTYNLAEFQLSGAGTVSVNGQIDEQELAISGSVRYFSADANTRVINANLAGNAEATVWVNEILNVEASDNAQFQYYGQPGGVFLGSEPEKVQALGEK
jgi:hypothetical protein